MAEYCGDLLDLQDRQLDVLHVRLTEHGTYDTHMDCAMAVRAPPGQRLTMTFDWFDIAPGAFQWCTADFLSVFDGELDSKESIEGLDEKLCGSSPPPSVASTGRALTLRFSSNSIEEGKGFSAIFTPFHEGECDDRSEFGCDNGRCIPRRLRCDDHDNCGDDSDSSCFLSVTQVVLAVLITTIIFAVIVGLSILYCNRHKLKPKDKKVFTTP
ncbi:hypothetical protein BaRGS_00003473 [Batillaria attramentaria]|uniref:CUB domain-containing protein n=1 Tax=Batillaria attramentaria TaxID=370345 RepID=A0ABD0M1F4_9CAEN